MRSPSGISTPAAEPGQHMPICRRSAPGAHGHVSLAQRVARLGKARIDASGNQYGDYEGLVSFSDVSHPIWTDSRGNLAPLLGCPQNPTMGEVFSATVRNLGARPRRSPAFRARHSRTRRVPRLARGAPLGSDSDRPGETRVERRRMVRAMVVVGARRHERVLIRAPRRAAAVSSAARRAADLAAIPGARIARGGMRGWA